MILVVIDNFSKFGWTVLTKSEASKTMHHSFDNILISFKQPILFESDAWKEIVSKTFTILLYLKSTIGGSVAKYIKKAVSAERFNQTKRDPPRKPGSEKRKDNSIDEMYAVTKCCNKKVILQLN